MHCRFCFRKRLWQKNSEKIGVISDKELADAVAYLNKNPQINEILLSGGDILILKDEIIEKIIDQIKTVSSIDTIRLASRLPVTLPARITDKFVKMLQKKENIWLVTHFNHNNELTEKARCACSKLIKAGIPVLNQSVLLKGINDNPDIIANLCKKLVAAKIKPLYLFHVDPIKSVTHFATGVDAGIKLMRQIRELSSLAMPIFAIDLPNGGGKVPLWPDYRQNNNYIALNGHKTEYPF